MENNKSRKEVLLVSVIVSSSIMSILALINILAQAKLVNIQNVNLLEPLLSLMVMITTILGMISLLKNEYESKLIGLFVLFTIFFSIVLNV